MLKPTRVVMRFAHSILIALTLLAAPHLALAVQPDEILPDPVLEGRARALSKELRCSRRSRRCTGFSS